MGWKKERTTAESAQTFTMLASYKHPSQSIRQRCIAIRLARPIIAFLPFPVLRNSRLYIWRAWGSLRYHAQAAWTNNARNCRRPVFVIGPWRQVLPLWLTLGQRPVYLLICCYEAILVKYKGASKTHFFFFFVNTSSLLPQNHPWIPIMQLLILLYMLWAICPAQVNVSNYRKWELQS